MTAPIILSTQRAYDSDNYPALGECPGGAYRQTPNGGFLAKLCGLSSRPVALHGCDEYFPARQRLHCYGEPAALRTRSRSQEPLVRFHIRKYILLLQIPNVIAN